jgi:predicted ATPase
VQAALPESQTRPDAAWPLPARVHAVIAARLEQLSDASREIVRLAASIGRSFTLDLLIEASGANTDVVVAALDELWHRQIIRAHGVSTYDFSHDKIREVAYTGMSAPRRVLLHRRVAEALERSAGANREGVNAQLAAHFEQGGRPAQAVPYYQRAAELAQRVYAHYEAIHLLRKGLDLLAALAPGPERDTRELAMQAALGTSLVATQGYAAPDAIAAYRRALTLCEELGQPASGPVLRGLAIASVSRALFDQAREFGDQLLTLAHARNDAALLVEGHYVQGAALFWSGELAGSREHLEQALNCYPSPAAGDHLRLYAQDPRIVCASRLAVDLWLLGHPREARVSMTRALELAHDLAHPFSLGYALTWSTWLAVLERNIDAVLEASETCLALSNDHAMHLWRAALSVHRGWALAERGDAQAGISLMREGLATHSMQGNVFAQPWYLGLLAEQQAKIGQIDEGLAAVGEALAAVQATGERWYEAELYRCRGVLLELGGQVSDAAVAFAQALTIAQQQGARGLELRAEASLAQLPRIQARRQSAR